MVTLSRRLLISLRLSLSVFPLKECNSTALSSFCTCATEICFGIKLIKESFKSRQSYSPKNDSKSVASPRLIISLIYIITSSSILPLRTSLTEFKVICWI
eukprot:NODE_44_length_33449_cov_1.575742.p40 type:complete len:100 gc:universal NODE_44_length_33449_cov_1.575742:801-502(-)